MMDASPEEGTRSAMKQSPVLLPQLPPSDDSSVGVPLTKRHLGATGGCWHKDDSDIVVVVKGKTWC